MNLHRFLEVTAFPPVPRRPLHRLAEFPRSIHGVDCASVAHRCATARGCLTGQAPRKWSEFPAFGGRKRFEPNRRMNTVCSLRSVGFSQRRRDGEAEHRLLLYRRLGLERNTGRHG